MGLQEHQLTVHAVHNLVVAGGAQNRLGPAQSLKRRVDVLGLGVDVVGRLHRQMRYYVLGCPRARVAVIWAKVSHHQPPFYDLDYSGRITPDARDRAHVAKWKQNNMNDICLLYTSPSPRD